MNPILFTEQNFSWWMMLAGAVFIGFSLGALVFLPLGRMIQKSKEGEAWARVNRMQRKFDELSAEYNRSLGFINSIVMAVDDWRIK